MKSVIVYYSKYGSTRDYAEWLAQDAGAQVVTLAEAKKLNLATYDVIVFGCPYYANRMKITALVKAWVPRLAGKRVAFFAVGGESPDSPDVRSIYNATLPEETRAAMRFFYLPGRVTLAKLNVLERTVLRMMKKADVDRTSKAAISPLVEFLKG